MPKNTPRNEVCFYPYPKDYLFEFFSASSAAKFFGSS